MRKLLLASAIMLSGGSFAYADNPLIPNDNDHLAALGFAIERNATVRSGRSAIEVVTATYRGGGTMMATSPASRASWNFLRYRADGDNK